MEKRHCEVPFQKLLFLSSFLVVIIGHELCHGHAKVLLLPTGICIHL